jgi:hypothetical protein
MAIDINIESQVSQTITDGVTDKAPSENAVFDVLALKIGGAVSIGQVAFGTDTNVIGGDSGFTWDNTNKRLGVGTSTPTARLHVQAQGALSTDIGFRVRNSADTANLFEVVGNGNFILGSSAINRVSNVNGTAELAGLTSARLVGGATHDRSLLISSTDIWLRHDIVKHQIGASSILWRSRYNGQNNVFELVESTKQSNILVIGNGTGIVSNPIYNDAFQLYSADITAGNSAPHFRTENGSVIKLYKETAVTTSQGIANALTNLGVLDTSTIAPSIPTHDGATYDTNAIQTVTAAEYAALTPNASTLYFIV